MKHKQLWESDTKLFFYVDDPHDERLEGIRNSAIRHLRSRGFSIGIDPYIKKNFPCIAKDCHRGKKGFLEVLVGRRGRCLEIVFFQNVIYENRNGGQYDFGKRQKMPYLIGKQYDLERNKLAALFNDMGFPFVPERRSKGMEFINQHRDELSAVHGEDYYTSIFWRQSSNCETKGKGQLRDDDEVYFVDNMKPTKYRTLRGRAWAHINNMWWVVLPSGEVRNIACFYLMHREEIVGDLRGRRVGLRDRAKKKKQGLERMISGEMMSADEQAALVATL